MAEQQGITKITVQGFKSLSDKAEVEIRPLTILAGANSSGKSSIMQPLLLMKQTLEAEYDTQALLLNGSMANFTNTAQFMNHQASKYFNAPPEFIVQVGYDLDIFAVGLEIDKSYSFDLVYASNNNSPALPLWNAYNFTGGISRIGLGLTHEDLAELVGVELEELRKNLEQTLGKKINWEVGLSKGFLHISLFSENGKLADFSDIDLRILPLGSLKRQILEMIYIAGFRGHPQRDYPLISSDFIRFQGRFENYTASVIHYWQNSDTDEDKQNLVILGEQLKELSLAPYIVAQPINDVQIEVRVGRTMQSGEDDTVSIADVGFGVSQVLPVLVALLVAEAGQLVYIEQPELHLHPRAQVKLAQILADAANRGVRLVVETHSSLLLLGLQTLIAEGKLKNTDMILHWFERDDEGRTKITPETPDENGAYGDWPQDFGDIRLETQSRYLEAVEKRLAEQTSGD
jgi:predicted ATPase